jgi:two-component system sensor histidine kinase DctS
MGSTWHSDIAILSERYRCDGAMPGLRGNRCPGAARGWHGRDIKQIGPDMIADDIMAGTASAEDRQARLGQTLRRSSATFLATTLIHDLSQPLSAINSWSSACLKLIAETPDVNGKLAERLGLLAQASRRATEIIRAFRDAVNQWQPTIVDVDVNAVLASVVGLIEEEARNIGVAVKLSLAAALPTARADPDLIAMTAYVLCQNSLDAIALHEPECRQIEICSHATDESTITVSVRDTGPGVDEETAVRLFEPLRTTKSHGAGIGLAQCRAAIETLGGRLWLQYNAPTGATFAFQVLAASGGGQRAATGIG